jgi:nicotinate phosphoribosyltransferase
MSIFDDKRLTNQTFKLDVERMRRGWYSDKYFENIGCMLTQLSQEGYRFRGDSPRIDDRLASGVDVGNMEGEMQIFCRHQPYTVVVGVDKALAMLRHCAGTFDEDGIFHEAWPDLEVEAVHDGIIVPYGGDPTDVRPVLRIRGRYRTFALLETPMLGILSRASRIATNVYNTLRAARGKPVLFFPARFDMHEVQAADGYAYHIAILRYNQDYGQNLYSFISTDAQGDWWGGDGGGTVPHAVIACFLGDTAEAMLQFARTQPDRVPRIALVDFNNDNIGDSLAVMRRLFARYRELKEAGDDKEAERFRLFGVRLDTNGNLRDVSLEPVGDQRLDMGVNPRLVFKTRQALDSAWQAWELPNEWVDEARAYCAGVRIVVSGGFNPDKIKWFEDVGAPADVYGVGSSLMQNDSTTNADFTADVVRVKVASEWVDMAKVGRAPCDNPDLARVLDYDPD